MSKETSLRGMPLYRHPMQSMDLAQSRIDIQKQVETERMQANFFGQKRQQTRTQNLLLEPSLYMTCSDLVSLLFLPKNT